MASRLDSRKQSGSTSDPINQLNCFPISLLTYVLLYELVHQWLKFDDYFFYLYGTITCCLFNFLFESLFDPFSGHIDHSCCFFFLMISLHPLWINKTLYLPKHIMPDKMLCEFNWSPLAGTLHLVSGLFDDSYRELGLLVKILKWKLKPFFVG
jgi:hypothetical protein